MLNVIWKYIYVCLVLLCWAASILFFTVFSIGRFSSFYFLFLFIFSVALATECLRVYIRLSHTYDYVYLKCETVFKKEEKPRKGLKRVITCMYIYIYIFVQSTWSDMEFRNKFFGLLLSLISSSQANAIRKPGLIGEIFNHWYQNCFFFLLF